MRLYLIPTEHTEMVWPLAEKHLTKADRYGGGILTVSDLRELVIGGNRQLWVVWEEDKCLAAIVTGITRGVFQIWALGGERLRDWMHAAHTTLEQFARAQGCSGMRLVGRPGWQRALQAYGYKRPMVVLHKEL